MGAQIIGGIFVSENHFEVLVECTFRNFHRREFVRLLDVFSTSVEAPMVSSVAANYDSRALTISEIHEALSKRLCLEISRKTIERDLLELADAGAITMTRGVPSRFVLNAPTEIELTLKVEELKSILESISDKAEINRKIKSILDSSGFNI